jgi:dTDP-glucose 4,6-dehydratase
MVGERIGKDSAYHLDSSKIRTELGWTDSVTLDQGLDECIAWVKENFESLKATNFDYIHKP